MNVNSNRSRIEESNFMSQYSYGGHHNLSQGQTEPMHHSPISSVSDRDRVNYLPCYLMGESPKGKFRKDASMTPNLDLSGIAGAGGMSMTNISGGGSGGSGQTSPLIPQSPISSTLNASSSTSPFNLSSSQHQATSPKPKSTGPPKHGLGHSVNTSTSAPIKSPTVDVQHGNWVTIFGFQPASQQFVLQNFSALGSIVDYKTTPGCNWIHVKYSNTVEARKALSKNGGIIGGNLMIGVIKTEAPTTITTNDNLIKTRIRPLANDNLANQVPVRETGIISKVTELFGW